MECETAASSTTEQHKGKEWKAWSLYRKLLMAGTNVF